MIHTARTGHTGGALSSLDILIALFFHTMRYQADNPAHPGRDRFILSKGHSVEGYYCVLAEAGFFPKSELATFSRFQSNLFGHPTMKVPGVEIPSGALGHGLSVGVGMALAAKRDGADYRVFTLMGDGEQAEGSIWEAAMAASHFGLDNLVAIIDHNKLQISGNVDAVMKLSLAERWGAFGWRVIEVDGNDMAALVELFDTIPYGRGKPLLVLAHTVKGKGFSFMENEASWHHRVPSESEMAIVAAETEAALAAMAGGAS
jgi:transketolase